MTKDLQPALSEIVSSDGTAHFGTYAGPLPPVSFAFLRDPRARSIFFRNTHLKKWIYGSIMGPDFIVATAIVHMRYAATAFLTVLDRKSGQSLFDKSWFAPGIFASVSDSCEQGCEASFRAAGVKVELSRPAGQSHYELTVDAGPTILHVCLETANSPTPISVVAPVADGVVNVTQKRVLLKVEGTLIIDDRAIELRDSFGGLDYTQGLLARHTSWRWAFAQGHSRSGIPIGMNVVDGFNQERECALWVGNEMMQIEPLRFSFDAADHMKPWKLNSPDKRIDLTFVPAACHSEKLNLGLLRSNFVQPLGAFSGSIAIAGRDELIIESLPGVVESQDVLW